MAVQQKFKYGLIALLVSVSLTGCGLDGEDGVAGEQGPQGPQGDPGTPGQDGQPGQNGSDASLGVTLSVVARAALGGEGAAEIVQYHAQSNTLYATNGSSNSISIISLANVTTTAMSAPITTQNLSFSTLALPDNVDGNALGGVTSVAVYGDLMAVAMAAQNKTDNGYVLFYNGLDASSPAFLRAVSVGSLPDMVTFTPDGGKVIVANEGEPSDDYTVDPEGSVTIIDILANNEPEVTPDTVTFTAFNDQKAALLAQGMHFPNPSGRTINGVTINTSVAQDLEPEYITATNATAYVTLQENNGVAVIDLNTLSVDVVGLGFKDWSNYQIDVNENDAVSFGRYSGLFGVYMPDTIASYSWKGATFLLTANEGDAREYLFPADDEAGCLAAGGLEFDGGDCLAYTDETRVSRLTASANSPLSDLQATGEADSLRVTSALGDTDGNGEYDNAYTYGARSFSIWDQNGLLVFDSGDDFERITASIHGARFNNDNGENASDSRSENKGPEPEALTVGQVGNRQYAFIGLERMSGIFVYDVTNPYDVKFVDYVINRDLTEGQTAANVIGDLGPESLVFVPADQSPTDNALLLVGNEISGTVTVWQIVAN